MKKANINKIKYYTTNNVLYPPYIVTKIMGLAPYSYWYTKTVGQWNVTKAGLIQTGFYMLATVGLIIPACQYQIRNLKTLEMDYISIFSDMFRTANGALLAMCLLGTTLMNRNKYCLLMNSIIDFDKDVKQLAINVDNNKMFKVSIRTVVTVCTIILTVMSADFVIFTKSKDILAYVYWFACIYFFFINMAGTMQFLCYLYMIYKRFATLNKYISNLSDSDMDVGSKKFNSWTWLKNSNRTMDISTIGKHTFRAKHIDVLPLNNGKINILCELHDNLCNLSKIVNSIYSLHILLITSTTFVVLVTQLYFFYLMLSSNEKYVLTYDKVWTAAIWGIMFFIVLFSISFACSKTKDEADVSSVLLHKINIEDDDDFTRTSVEMFSLQMLHQKVEFSACGFFPVDFSVLYMIIGAVTTYLVFLIQFEMAGRSPPESQPTPEVKKS